MRARALWSVLPLMLGLGVGVAGCVDNDPAPVAVVVPTAPAATVVIDWTIQGRVVPGDCFAFGVDSIQINVVTAAGFDAGTYAQVCTAFATSIVLAPGTYTATAQLLDPAGIARSTAVEIAPFTLFGNDQFIIPIDFPADSFF